MGAKYFILLSSIELMIPCSGIFLNCQIIAQMALMLFLIIWTFDSMLFGPSLCAMMMIIACLISAAFYEKTLAQVKILKIIALHFLTCHLSVY